MLLILTRISLGRTCTAMAHETSTARTTRIRKPLISIAMGEMAIFIPRSERTLDGRELLSTQFAAKCSLAPIPPVETRTKADATSHPRLGSGEPAARVPGKPVCVPFCSPPGHAVDRRKSKPPAIGRCYGRRKLRTPRRVASVGVFSDERVSRRFQHLLEKRVRSGDSSHGVGDLKELRESQERKRIQSYREFNRLREVERQEAWRLISLGVT